MGKSIINWLVIVIGLLFIPPVNSWIDGFYEGFTNISNVNAGDWLVSIIIIIVGIIMISNKNKAR